MGQDPERNNDFDYTVEYDSEISNLYCPFTAHVRKVVSRNLDPFVQEKYLESTMIMRAGIAYGPTVRYLT